MYFPARQMRDLRLAGGDDFEVTLEQNLVKQKDDYYLFGLTFNQFRRIGDIPNKYLYQGNEQLENMDWYGPRIRYRTSFLNKKNPG